MKRKKILLGLVVFVAMVACGRKEVYFANLKDGAQVKSPFKVEMGARGLKVMPAGEIKKGTGHHHILIDRGFFPQGQVIPTDENHQHFGGGQTEAELALPPGKHRLTLQFADGIHRSYGRELSASIQVTVSQ